MQDDTYRKDVVLVTVAFGVVVIFRSRVGHGETWLVVFDIWVVRLTKVNEFDAQLAMHHYVGGFEIKVCDLVFLKVSQTLSNHDEKIDFRLQGYGILVLTQIFAQVGVVYVVYK